MLELDCIHTVLRRGERREDGQESTHRSKKEIKEKSETFRQAKKRKRWKRKNT